MAEITLNNPIDFNGKKRSEFAYDTMAITSEEFMDAAAWVASRYPGVMMPPEANSPLHFRLGCLAITKACPEVDMTDIVRAHGPHDVMEIAAVGRSFTLGLDSLGGESFDEESENTPENSTAQ